ncbi:G3E family GTPase [Halanaerobium saccharolyticum]|uniref:G3E family GTPase n=1 Tax=Halanaerobium saccharolyticum TaxID=43595 RepID=A0A4R6LRN6_9FIRM|nr:GTP-binding protein [Halanaerobium saccharolyticum]TDO90119.1 G3E family GTPase [Halanaerobium saccharolyticum]
MIKIDVISGFLGAGKTTFVKRLLKAYQKENVVLIENEFGEIGIDGELIEREGFDVFEISTGCICCIMQDDFIEMLEKVIVEFNPERIIVEPTGISITSEIIDILNQPKFIDKCTINTLITIVDSLNYLEQREAFGEFFEDQIINATTLILSKTQLVNQERRAKTITSLRKLNDEVELLTKSWDKLSLNDIKGLLDDKPIMDLEDIFHTEYKPCSEDDLDTFAIETSNQYSREELNYILVQLDNPLYGRVLRGKGFLSGFKRNLEFSYTNGGYNIDSSKSDLSGRVCLIGKDLDEAKIKELFRVQDGGVVDWLQF